MKKDLIRVTFPAKQVAAARELGKPEHASVAQIARRALQKEIDSHAAAAISESLEARATGPREIAEGFIR